MNFKKIFEKEMIADTSRRQKAEQMFKEGNPKGIKTFCIITAENPMGETLTSQENKELNNRLEYYLKLGNYKWFPIKGNYEVKEKSYIIYNISKKDAEKLGNMFNQDSIIFATIDGSNVKYEYMKKERCHYNITKTESTIVDATNDEKFWSQIGKDFKFRVPFFDHACDINLKLSKVADAERLLEETVNDKWTGKHHYILRYKLWR